MGLHIARMAAPSPEGVLIPATRISSRTLIGGAATAAGAATLRATAADARRETLAEI
jgi:hypothetical protein